MEDPSEEAVPSAPPPPSASEGEGLVATFFHWSRELNRWLHWVSGATIVGIMLLTVVDVLGRRFFGSPLRGSVELTQVGLVVLVYLGFAYAENQGDHIAVDIVYTRLRRGVQLVLTTITSLIGIAVIGLLAYQIYQYAGVLAGGGRTTPTRGIPMAPFAIAAAAGAIVFTVALLDSAIGALRRFKERD